MRKALPNFRGQRALILHWNDGSRMTLVRQLKTLGLGVDVLWPADRVSSDGYDVIFFDADQGYDDLFDWPPGDPPIPLIAMMGSEAPGRIEWTLSRAPSAYLVKPVGSTGVFSALAIAYHTFETRKKLKDAVAELTRRAMARPMVFKAILRIMAHLQVGEDVAYRLLRAESMRLRVPVEEVCKSITDGGEVQLNRLASRNRRSLRQVSRG